MNFLNNIKCVIILIVFFATFVTNSQNNAPNDIPFQSYDKELSPEHRLHFLVGATASSMAYDFTYRKTQNKNKAFWNGVTASIGVGIVKESIDAAVRDSHIDKNDLFSAILGGVTAGITINILNSTKKNKKQFKQYGKFYERHNKKLIRKYRKHFRKNEIF
jgi:hypothetical protein